MKVRARLFSVLAVLYLCWVLIPCTAGAVDKTMLKGETWTPSFSPPAAIVGPEFIKGLQEATGGNVTTSWHTAGSLGPAPEVYTRVLMKVSDWGQINAGYTPGTFPITEMFELPISFGSAEALTKAMIRMWKMGYLDKDYAKVKLLFIYGIGPYQLWSSAKIEKIEDFSGKKLRCPSDTFVDMTKALRAIPVSVPAGEIYTAMQKKIVDGTWACGDMAHAFKIAEVAPYVTITDIGTTTQSWIMNKRVYEKLPDPAKRYIQENVERLSLFGAQVFDKANEKGFQFARQHEVRFVRLNESEKANMNKVLVPVFKKWVDRLQSEGYDGLKILSDFHDALVEVGVKAPFKLPTE